MADLSLTCTAYIPDLFWIVILLMFSFVAVVYAIGKILTRTELEATARTELREVALSVAIGLGSVGMALALCNITTLLLPSFENINNVFSGANVEIPDHFRAAEIYVSTLTNNIGVPTIMNLETLAFAAYLAQTTIRSTTGINFLAALSTLTDVINIFITLIFSPMVTSLNIQLISLSISKGIGLAVVLPAGIIARAFSYTRDAGSFLIALGIGIYFLWPMLYMINYEISLKIFPNLNLSVAVPPTNLSAFPGTNMVNILVDQMFNNFSIGSQLLLQGLVLPLLNMSLFLGFVRVFSEFISSIR